jgi:hypothetical protein
MYPFCQNYWVLTIKALFMPFNIGNHIKLVVHRSNVSFKGKAKWFASRSKEVCDVMVEQ